MADPVAKNSKKGGRPDQRLARPLEDALQRERKAHGNVQNQISSRITLAFKRETGGNPGRNAVQLAEVAAQTWPDETQDQAMFSEVQGLGLYRGFTAVHFVFGLVYSVGTD